MELFKTVPAYFIDNIFLQLLRFRHKTEKPIENCQDVII